MLTVTWWNSLSQLSFWAVLITVILFWLVCRGQPLRHCNVYKTQPLDWWWDCQLVITSDLRCENCTGCHLPTASSSRWRYWCTWITTLCALCISAKCWHQSVALPCVGNYVPPAAATTPYQEQGPSSATELFQSLDQSSGTLSPSSSEQPTTFKHSNVYSKCTLSTFLTDLINSTITMLLF